MHGPGESLGLIYLIDPMLDQGRGDHQQSSTGEIDMLVLLWCTCTARKPPIKHLERTYSLQIWGDTGGLCHTHHWEQMVPCPRRACQQPSSGPLCPGGAAPNSKAVATPERLNCFSACHCPCPCPSCWAASPPQSPGLPACQPTSPLLQTPRIWEVSAQIPNMRSWNIRFINLQTALAYSTDLQYAQHTEGKTLQLLADDGLGRNRLMRGVTCYRQMQEESGLP